MAADVPRYVTGNGETEGEELMAENNASRVNLQSILEADVAMGIRRQADSSLFSLALSDRVFGKVYAETDPTEAFATRQLAYRESPINPVAPS